MKRLLRIIMDKLNIRSLHALKKNGYLVDVGWFRSFKEKKSVDKDGNPIPWIAYPAIKFLESRLNKEMTVFEFGSGASTIWWAKRTKTVHAVEHDKEWFDKVRAQLPDNASVRFSQGDEYIHAPAATGKIFDIIFVDGRNRVDCIKNSLDALKDDGVIILDDSFREEYSEALGFLRENNFKSLEISGPAPIYCNYGEITIFYRSINIFKI